MVDSLGLYGNKLVGILPGGGGGVALEVEPDLYLFAGIDFRGAIRVDLGLGFRQTKKNERERERKGNQKFV